jgi:hypothetical protein
MKVRELIQQLTAFNQDADVFAQVKGMDDETDFVYGIEEDDNCGGEFGRVVLVTEPR